jgi:hypothetical protein
MHSQNSMTLQPMNTTKTKVDNAVTKCYNEDVGSTNQGGRGNDKVSRGAKGTMIYIVIVANIGCHVAHNKAKLRQICEDLASIGQKFTVFKGDIVNYEEE